MLKSLRWQLTLLYLLAAVGLVSLMGAGTYALIDRYFQQTTDLALQYKMAAEFHLLGLPLPTELARAEHQWIQNNARAVSPVAQPNTVVVVPKHTNEDESGEEDDDNHVSASTTQVIPSHVGDALDEDQYDADLAAVFVISRDANGNPILVPNLTSPPIVDSPAAFANAQKYGYDLRTVDVPGKGRIRLLTYSTGVNVPTVLQTGRLLTDQDRVLKQYLTYLLILGGAASLLLALVSWWLAGRSLGPAQKAWDQQQAFVSNASHELRTPLTLIRATADYGLRSRASGERSKALGDILNECDYMDHLVDDLLTLSRLDARRLKIEHELVPLADLFSDTIRQMEKLARTKDVSLESGPTQGQVRGDRTHLRQVLLILMDNALRFTPAGGSIRLEAHPDGKMVEIDVVDTGKGIDPKHLPHLFDRFFQVSTSENDSSRSNGLGLSIAKALIEAQGGSIRIESKLGKGTRVRLALPAA